MVLGKRAFALQAGGDGRGQQFREPLERSPRLRVVNSLPGVNHGLFRLDKRGCGPTHIRNIRPIAREDRGLVHERPGNLLRKKVNRNLDQRGTAAPVTQARKGPPENVGDLSRRRNWLG